ncbi:MAG TPA: cell filamentation protein Fic, partial [Coxiellaceae bacterium]|nr:cell filamentation protein Fic [Coxiellaceae bacterium]
EPGSNEQVLKNHLSIQSKDIMDQVEARELKRAELEIIDMFDEHHQFTSQDICHMHAVWLENIYLFAGHYRSVNMSKEGFPFAGANYISGCMRTFERDYLAKYTPCYNASINDLSYALGIVHVEFILIHPF